MLNSIKWVGIGKFSFQALNFVTNLVLVSLLSPFDFGLVASATAFFGVFAMLRNFGLGEALIRKSKLDKTEFSSMFWLVVFNSLILSIFYILGYIFSSIFFKEEAIGPVIAFLYLAFFIQGLYIIPLSELERQKKFKTVFKIEIAALIISCTIGILLAIEGYNYYSILVKLVSFELVLALVLLIMMRKEIHFNFSLKQVKTNFNFSLPLLGSQLLNYTSRNLDDYMIGRFLGTQVLGIYNRAYNFSLYSFRGINDIINRALYPELSAYKNEPKKLGSYFLTINLVVCLIFIPIAIGLFYYSEPLIRSWFDVQWLALVDILKIFAFVLIFQSLSRNNGLFFKIIDKTKLQFKIDLLTKPVTIILILFSIFYYKDIQWVAYFYAIGVFISAIVQWFHLTRELKVSSMDYGVNIIAALIPAGIAFSLSYMLELSDSIPSEISLIFFGVIYIFILFLTRNYYKKRMNLKS
jgi:PST family polysaccharide transporter